MPPALPVNIDAKLPTAEPTSKRMYVGAKLRAVIDLMIFEGKEMDQAAQIAKTSTRAVRKAFERPHVLSYLRKRREVLRAAACGKNELRLVQIRDAADNQPAINAIRTLEYISSEDRGIRGGAATSPGIVIRIMTSNAAQSELAPVTIDAVANEDETD
jgi:hypothetical protein